MHIYRSIRSEVRSRGGSTLLAALLLICTGCRPRSHDLHSAEEDLDHPRKLHQSYQYYETEDGRVKHGLYLLADDEGTPSTIVKCGRYINGLKEGLWVEYDKYGPIWSFWLYEHDRPKHLDVYNRSLLRVSSLEFRDGVPWDGTWWILRQRFSEEGMVPTECTIEEYQTGKLVDTVPCDLDGYAELPALPTQQKKDVSKDSPARPAL